jgi:hypothetical protein
LWQLQELEGVAAQYFVLVVQAKRGMGQAAGDILTEKALGKTFGATIHEMTKAGLLDIDIETRFSDLLTERNWLVHKSRSQSRSAIYNDATAAKLMSRLDEIANESLVLLRKVGARAERHVKVLGVTQQFIDTTAAELLRQWHESDAI